MSNDLIMIIEKIENNNYSCPNCLAEKNKINI